MTPPPGYNLVFSDEFDGNLDKWNVKNNWKPSNSPVCMLSENVYISGVGALIIKSRNEGGSSCGLQRSSGYVDTKGKFSGKYYYAEMRAKLPRGKGIWPAFWMLPEGGGWPPEIDIFEMLGDNTNKLYFTVHTQGNDPDCGGYSNCKSGSYVGNDFSADYHIYGMEWTSDYVAWFVDGIERFRSREYVPQVPMFLVIDTYIGGDWPGNPDNTTQWPQYFYVDYVRVYQKGIEPLKRYRCSGSPDFVCIEDINGEFDSIEVCQAACKAPIPETKKFKVNIVGKSVGVLVTKSSKGDYTSGEACKLVCDTLKQVG